MVVAANFSLLMLLLLSVSLNTIFDCHNFLSVYVCNNSRRNSYKTLTYTNRSYDDEIAQRIISPNGGFVILSQFTVCEVSKSLLSQ